MFFFSPLGRVFFLHNTLLSRQSLQGRGDTSGAGLSGVALGAALVA